MEVDRVEEEADERRRQKKAFFIHKAPVFGAGLPPKGKKAEADRRGPGSNQAKESKNLRPEESLRNRTQAQENGESASAALSVPYGRIRIECFNGTLPPDKSILPERGSSRMKPRSSNPGGPHTNPQPPECIALFVLPKHALIENVADLDPPVRLVFR